jgi:hypothetical protein
MRPNLFVNTPDILTEYLQYGGRPAYKIRAAIAATTAAPTACTPATSCRERRPARVRENIDNEKYEYKLRDWEADGDSLAPYLTRLNEIRRAHPALQQLPGLQVHWSDDDAILVVSASTTAPHRHGSRHDHRRRQRRPLGAPDDRALDSTVWGVARGADYEVEDLVTGRLDLEPGCLRRLDAFAEPVHILHVKERDEHRLRPSTAPSRRSPTTRRTTSSACTTQRTGVGIVRARADGISRHGRGGRRDHPHVRAGIWEGERRAAGGLRVATYDGGPTSRRRSVISRRSASRSAPHPRGSPRELWQCSVPTCATTTASAGSFAVWAPHARRARRRRLQRWDGRRTRCALGSSGVWELFVPGSLPATYKYEILTARGWI